MKKNQHYIIIVVTAILLILISSQQLNQNQLTIDSEMPDSDEVFPEIDSPELNIIKINHENIDIQNENQGTLIIQLRVPLQTINPTGSLDKIVLFSSNYLESFMIVYNLGDKTIEAGVPVMHSTPVDLFDGGVHQLSYTFDRSKGQVLYFDGKVIAAGNYNGRKVDKNKITGFVIKTKVYDEITVDSKMEIYDYLLNIEEINSID